MFFNIRSIDLLLIDIDSVSADLVAQTVLSFSSSKKIALLSRRENQSAQANIPVFSPSNRTESSLFQNVIRRAVNSLECQLSGTVVLSGNSDLITTAKRLFIGTIAVLPPLEIEKLPFYASFPDMTAISIQEIEQIVSGKYQGYIGELLSIFPGSHPIFPEMGGFATCQSIPNPVHRDAPIVVSGRYFDSQDPRHNLHALSIRITNSKSYPERQIGCFSQITKFFLSKILNSKFDLITRIPPRPGATDDRLSTLLNSVGKDFNFAPDVVRCIRDYPKLSKTSSAAERRLAVNGAFCAAPSVKDKHIVLIDDVVTTTLTMNECINELKKAGAARISPFAIGYHPFRMPVDVGTSPVLRCSCGSLLKPRCNKNDGSPFFGCERFFDSCKTTESFRSGTNTLLQAIHSIVGEPDDELQSQYTSF